MLNNHVDYRFLQKSSDAEALQFQNSNLSWVFSVWGLQVLPVYVCSATVQINIHISLSEDYSLILCVSVQND